MIDALETVIQYLKTGQLSTAQIASKERYGEVWINGTPSIVVNLDSGTPDLYLPVQNVRLEIRAFGSTQYAAVQLMNELVTLSRSTDRELVNTQQGAGLLYYLNQASGISLLYDDTVGMDFAIQFYEAKVTEEGV